MSFSEYRPESARDYLRMVVERVESEAGPGAEAKFVLARIRGQLGETREAAGHLRRACQLDPQQAGAFYALFEALSLLGEAEGARDSLERFQELKQKERDFYGRRHQTYDDEGYMRGLVSGFHIEVAGLFVRQRQPVLAETQLRQAIRIAPASVAAHEMLAAVLLQSGRRAKARDVCASIVRLDPKRASYRANLGTLLLQLNEPTAAVEELKCALELDPGQVEALHNLARFYLGARRDLTEALALSRRLVELRPVASSYDLLGWALYVNGQPQEARAAAAQAVELDPNNPVYRERLQRLGGER